MFHAVCENFKKKDIFEIPSRWNKSMKLTCCLNGIRFVQR